MKRRLRLVVGIVISLIALWYVLRGMDWRELWAVYRGANYLFVIPALLLLFLISWTRAYRWRLLIYPRQGLSLGRLFAMVNIGYLFNNVLPAKAGEVGHGQHP